MTSQIKSAGSPDHDVGAAVTYATASPEAVAALAADHYGFTGELHCSLLNRGFNDLYSLTTATGQRFVLRVSGRRARGAADVASETAFLAYLDQAGVPVAAAVPTVTGAMHATVPLPDAERPVVLFAYLEGRAPELDSREDARLQGMTLAHLHDAADRYPAREAGRYRLDLAHLLHRPAASVLALGLEAPQATGEFTALVARLAERVGTLDAALTRTRCHGDCHGLNARIPVEGRFAGQAVFFDFDDGGFGYLAYDVAVHLWAQLSFGRTRHVVWHAFQRGYEEIRPITPADEAALPLFAAIRHIWFMGTFAAQSVQWGSEPFSAAWLKREVAFLLGWERDRLSPGLL